MARTEAPRFVVRLPVTAFEPAPRPPAAAAPGVEEIRAASLRILAVDDNVHMAQGLASILRMWGHDVRTAHDGAAALEVATQFAPEVVLLDSEPAARRRVGGRAPPAPGAGAHPDPDGVDVGFRTGRHAPPQRRGRLPSPPHQAVRHGRPARHAGRLHAFEEQRFPLRPRAGRGPLGLRSLRCGAAAGVFPSRAPEQPSAAEASILWGVRPWPLRGTARGTETHRPRRLNNGASLRPKAAWVSRCSELTG